MNVSSPLRQAGKRLQRVTALERLPRLAGRTVLVTGGTDGVGRALVDQLATTGATVVLTARDAAKAAAVCTEVEQASGNRPAVVPLDLANLESVRTAAVEILERWDRLDCLIANAAHQAGKVRTTTADGFEMTFGVNHLAHALLIELLEDRLTEREASRVVIVASEAHRRARGGLDFDDLQMANGEFRPKLAYNRSKLANILHARRLATRLADRGVDVFSLHPGAVDTPMMRANFTNPVARTLYPALRAVLLITPHDAAAGILRVALDTDLHAASGSYFEHGALNHPSVDALDDDAGGRLWQVTHEMIEPTS